MRNNASPVDDVDPLLISVSAAQPVVNLTEGNTYDMKIVASDELSGISYVRVSFIGESNDGGYTEIDLAAPVAGEPFAFNLTHVFQPSYYDPIRYAIEISLSDFDGNRIFLDYYDLEDLGFPGSVLVTRAPDVTPPELVSMRALSPTTVDVSNAETNVDFEITARDDQPGIKSGYLKARHEDASGIESQYGGGFEITGPNWTGINSWTGSISILVDQNAKPGVYNLEMYLVDLDEVRGTFSSEQLRAKGFPSTITVA